MTFGLFDGEEDGEHSGVGFVELSSQFVMQEGFYDGVML